MRAVVAALVLTLLAAVPADAKLRSVGKLRAKAGATSVKLTWRDRSRGETRYVVRRQGRKARLKRNRRRFTDRRVQPGTRYRYTVRACRRKRCAKPRRVTVRTRARGGGTPGAGGGGGGGGGRVRRQPDDRRLPGLPEGQPVEHRRLGLPGRHLARLHRHARRHDAVAGLRRRRRVRHPVRERAVLPAARAGELRGGRRVRSRAVPDPARRAGRGRRRPSRADAPPGRLQAVRAVRRRALGLRLERLQRGGVGPALERAAAGALDLRRRGGPPDPARAGAARGGRQRRHPPRAADHRPRHPAGLHPPGDPLGVETTPTRTCRRWGCACG